MDNDLLKYAIDHGMIDLSYVQEKIEMNKREELLKKHPYKIWKGKNGKWYTYFPDEQNGRVQRERNSKAEIKDIVVEYWKEKSENPTIKETFDEWNNRRLELKKISPATHLRNNQTFNRHYKEFGKRKIKSIESEDFSEFLEDQIPAYNLSAKAFSNLKTITRGFLKRAKKRKLIGFNVEELFQELDVSDTDFKKVIKEDYEEVFNDEEMDKMTEYIKDNLDVKNIGILLMFVTGIRVGELVSLKHSDFTGNTIKIRRTETRYLDKNNNYVYDIKEFPKTGAGVRTVIIPEDYSWLCTKIKALNLFGEFVFTDDKGKRLSTQAVRMRLKRVCKNTKVYHKSPHKIRKTYGSILLDNNMDRVLITGQMGHTNIITTENHYHRNRKSMDRKSQIISAIPEFQTEYHNTRTHV